MATTQAHERNNLSGPVLLGHERTFSEMPADVLLAQLAKVPASMKSRLAFMGEEHHLVRNFAVRELPQEGRRAIDPKRLAETIGLPARRVSEILSDLERKLFFLVRNSAGFISWAFPVTVETTPHRLIFSTGERTHGAWAEDAFATPFVQGRLRGQKLSAVIETRCEHCHQKLHISVDSEFGWEVQEKDPRPLLFEPDIDWRFFKGANIINDYWRKTVFFWSEEQARDYRERQNQVNGIYLTLDQAAYAERIAQSGLFSFSSEVQPWNSITSLAQLSDGDESGELLVIRA